MLFLLLLLPVGPRAQLVSVPVLGEDVLQEAAEEVPEARGAARAQLGGTLKSKFAVP